MPLRMSDDFEDLQVAATPVDVEALRRARAQPSLASADYEWFLAQFEVTIEEQQRRQGPRGEPFRL